MKIDRLYKEKFVLSFEIFPPKTERGEENLWKEMKKLSTYNPGFISVTYGAGGSTREKTLDISLRIKNDFGMTPLVHFTCVGTSKDEIREYLLKVKANGIENILALRGDPPQGETEFTPHPGGFNYANELIEYIRSINGFSISAAGYPEGHIEAPDLDTDIDNLKKKIDAGAELILTQLFYNNNDYFNFLDRVVQKGITVPIVPGIMPVRNLAQIEKITGMCGASIPEELLQALNSCSSDDDVCSAGIDYSIKQCEELLAGGVPGFHFYSLNKSTDVKKIIDALDIPD